MRRRLVLGLVVFVGAWPLITLGLQWGFRVDPWKLMSFGMYAVPPRRDVRATLGDLSGQCASWVELDRETALVRTQRTRACDE